MAFHSALPCFVSSNKSACNLTEVAHDRVRFLKIEDDSLALLDEGRAALMKSYFSTVGEKLTDELPPSPPVIECSERKVIRNMSSELPPLNEITVSQGSVCKKSDC